MNLLLRSSRMVHTGIRSMSRTSSADTAVVASQTEVKFVVVDGKFKPVKGENLPTLTEEITHTGQYFDEKDWKRNRYIDRKKTVNRNWAVEMINEVPPIEVDARVTYCDGASGEAELGHPRVFINLDKGKPVSCLYCGLRFVRKAH